MPGPADRTGLLRRVFAEEQRQEYRDRSTFGGLSAFVANQISNAGEPPARHLTDIAEILKDYSRLQDVEKRSRLLGRALTALEGKAADELAPVKAKPAETPARIENRTAVTSPPRRERTAARKSLDGPVTVLRGVGPKLAEPLGRLNIHTVRDLLHHFPREHYDYRDTASISRLRLGKRTTLVGTVKDVRNNRTRRGVVITTAAIADESGTVAVRWFNQPFMLKNLALGSRVAITGEPEVFDGRIVFAPRDYERIEGGDTLHSGRLVPVYPLTKGLYARSFRALIKSCLDQYLDAVDDFLPASLLDAYRLLTLPEAIAQYHFPEDEMAMRQAQRRLAFDELFLIQLGLLRRKEAWREPIAGTSIIPDPALLARFKASLPFPLTLAQQRVIDELLADMEQDVPANRLLQGDVGSGKTVVAAAALLSAVEAGRQGAVMAPTEILAEQHAKTLANVLKPFNVTVALLVGSLRTAQRKTVLADVSAGNVHLLVGTQALIQEGVEFKNLGLVVTDEQHRFGVNQRALLRQKGLHPHVLSMTATPIPRTLALTIYGDLDVSALDEMPAGRIPVETRWARSPLEAYALIRREVNQGRQAFIICPVIEESADSDMRSVLTEHRELQKLTFPDLQVGLLHGKLKAAEKEKVLHEFRDGRYHVLVATSVVEVGIDVPNATVMVIRDAHRFGLAQLHQFRGRVGRGGGKAYCLLLSSLQRVEIRDRLEALTRIQSGFELAEKDLELRGPGEFWGIRQSGMPELKVANLTDLATVHVAREAAQAVLAEDPELTSPSHATISRELTRFWAETTDFS